jgi:hypothetical protein
LHINVNELLSGEQLSDHNYSQKAEETLLTLLCLAAILICGKHSKQDILHLLNQILIPIGAIISIVSFILVLCLLDLPDGIGTIGPNLAVAVLSLLYAICAKVVVVIWIERKEL